MCLIVGCVMMTRMIFFDVPFQNICCSRKICVVLERNICYLFFCSFDFTFLIKNIARFVEMGLSGVDDVL